MSLFSAFNPESFLNMPLNWIMILLPVLVITTNFWKSNNQISMTTISMKSTLLENLKSVSSVNMPSSTLTMMMTLFFMIMSVNSLGLPPFIFPTSAHLSFTLSLALPMWLGASVFSWLLFPKNSMAHLVPVGSPLMLAPFMVIIEIISTIIRPITLSVRLAANVTAGHLILTLIGTATTIGSLFTPLVLIMMLLMILETAVALIQAYVFSVLMTLYMSDMSF